MKEVFLLGALKMGPILAKNIPVHLVMRTGGIKNQQMMMMKEIGEKPVLEKDGVSK